MIFLLYIQWFNYIFGSLFPFFEQAITTYNEFETTENKIYTKDEIELDWQQTHQGFSWRRWSEYDWKTKLKK